MIVLCMIGRKVEYTVNEIDILNSKMKETAYVTPMKY